VGGWPVSESLDTLLVTQLLAEKRKVILEVSTYDPRSIPAPLLARILKNIDKPEEKVRYKWVLKLINQYGYSPNRIRIEVPAGAGRDAEKASVRADIVAYRDDQCTEPFIVIETKEPNEETKGILQAESYARVLGADYHVWSNGTVDKFFRTSKYPNQSVTVADIPHWLGTKPVTQRLAKKDIKLPPFRNEHELRTIIRTAHNLIYSRLGHDPAKAFDELTKLLFLKLYDERESKNYYEFVVMADDTPADTAKRIRELFNYSIHNSKYRDVFVNTFIPNQVINLELDDYTIQFVVKLLQGYSLIDTTETIQGADIKGTVFEQMVGSTFRGELGQYFTPRQIVQCMVEILDPAKDSLTLDVSCGSGGFLIMVLRRVRQKLVEENPNLSEGERAVMVKEFAENNLFGVDINDRMVRVAKMNMIMHGDGHSGIFHANGLLISPDISPEMREGTFDYVFSNPPFAGFEKDDDILKLFDVTKNEKGEPVTAHKEVPFVEKIIRMLKVGGKAGIVLPLAVFNSSNMAKLRDYIYKKTKILAVIGLPDFAFFHTGTGVLGALLFLERTDNPPKDYEVFIDWAEHVGYDSVGKPDEQNDLLDIPRRFRNPTAKNLIPLSQMQKEGRIDPNYYNPKFEQIVEVLKSSPFPTRRLWPDCVEISQDRVDFTKAEQETFNYIEINNVDLERGVIEGYETFTKEKIPNRATYLLREGDLLIPSAKPSMKGVAVVPKEYEGCIGTNRFIVCKPKINASYLRHILSTEVMLELLRRETTGSTTPDIRPEQLGKLPIPVPPPDTMDMIVKWLTEREHEVRVLEDRARGAKVSLLEQILRNMTKQESANDLAWIASNPPELARYEGRYVAISGKRIIGVGDTSTLALEEAKKTDASADPLIMLVSFKEMSF
jgi:type I restriction enzyme M protein